MYSENKKSLVMCKVIYKKNIKLVKSPSIYLSLKINNLIA